MTVTRHAKKKMGSRVSLLAFVALCPSLGCVDDASLASGAGGGGTKYPDEIAGARGDEAGGHDPVGGSGAAGESAGTAAVGAAGDAVDAALPIDAANETSDSGPPCAGLFCEDFEQGQIDPAKWNVQTTGGATTVVQQRNVAHGKYAAQFHGLGVPAGGASSAYAYLIAKVAPASLLVHNFGRAYFFIAPKPRSINLGMVFGGTTGFPKPTYLSIASHSGGWQLGFIKLQGSPTGERQAYPSGQMPAMTWTCLEWELDDQPDSMNVWGDGVAIGSLDSQHVDYPAGHVSGTPIFNDMSSGLVGGFTDFGFGFYDWHPGGFDFDLYYDDIVLDTKRVGCL